MFKWLWSLVDICNDRMGEPYRKCKRAFDDAYHDCRDRLGIFKFLCEIVDAASNLCHLARIGELLCAIVQAVKDLIISTVKKKTVGSVNRTLECASTHACTHARKHAYTHTHTHTHLCSHRHSQRHSNV